MDSSASTINNFTQLIKDRNAVFSPTAWRNLAQLNATLEKLGNDAQPSQIADIILRWCNDYPDIRNRLRSSCDRADIVDNENEDRDDSNPRQDQLAIDNKFMLYETIKNALDQPPPSQQQKKT